ncbi:uncharacterized protein N7498_004684 [Penicillium cinerascens]|uniref:Uncharacterized protein n=1 Tax=Penicillium cinerascens TaxID=70096 RepID=A0A9W9MLZ9_9EURO|nr:uncharacterized protein N7498_004684 [Penicillium cinerascens]KAJ5203805.1 hypothetical protein N7498_004684 [Penicillium cinerascens]
MVKSRLLVINALDSEFIHLYETQISSKVLRILDNLSTASSAEPNILHNYNASEAAVDVDTVVIKNLKRKYAVERGDRYMLKRKL